MYSFSFPHPLGTPLTHQRHHPIAPYKPLSLPTLSRSLPPFLIPLAMRLLARRLRSASSQYGGTTDLLASHNAAQDRRTASAFFFTGPMWVGWTRPKITSWIEWLERWPVVGIAGSWAGGYLPLVDDYYYCELGSELGVGLGFGRGFG